MAREIRAYSKGQVTIFIIIALIIVVGIILVVIIFREPTVSGSATQNPDSYIEKCTKDATEEAINALSAHGGDIEPEGSVMYQGERITYLCYNSEYYLPCVNQRPLLVEHIESEITDYVEPKVQNCFSSLKQDLEDKNYQVGLGSMNISTKLRTNGVIVSIDRKLTLTKGEETRKFEWFTSQVSSPIYELAKIAMEITNQEARFCNFENLGFMIFYPDYNIDKFRTGNADNIYTLKETSTGKAFKFAIRSCVMPAGF
jgi:hypothetical protein